MQPMRATMFSQRKMRRASAMLAWFAALPLTQRATANELFLIPDKPIISIRSQPLIRLVGDDFDKSDPPIERDNLINMVVAGNGRVTRLRDGAWYDDAECIVTSVSTHCGPPRGPASQSQTVSILKYAVDDAGTYVVDISKRPQVVTVSSGEFAGHLRQSGTSAAFEASVQGNSTRPIRERQSSFARAIVQVLEQRTSDYARDFNHPIEIALDQNPYDRSVGDPVSFRVLRDGKPAVNQLVTVGYRDPQAAPPGRVSVYELRTDNQGRTSFILSTRGLWYVSVLDVRKSSDTKADYDATWSTVTFRTM
jgi:hypothetical protein